MSKKFIVTILILSITNSGIGVFASSNIDRQIRESRKVEKYNSVKKHSASYTENFYKNKKVEIKDPKLIKFKSDELKKINDKSLAQKQQRDEIYYSKHVVPYLKENMNKYNKTMTVDFYNLYRVAEKIIRANGLDYVNWRIVLIDSTGDFNAGTFAGNLICINSALYDSFHNNNDALAFIIGHEIAHQVLGHSQQKVESARRTDITNNVLLYTTLGYGNLVYMPVRRRVEAKAQRSREYIADTLGAEFAVRAGYDYSNIMSALNFMSTLPHVETTVDSHPIPEKRIANLQDAQKYFLAQWKNEGTYNLYNSKPLECKRSSDRVSIILSAREENKDGFYKPEATEEILKRVGYIDYKNGNIENAIKYFTQWSEISNSYIPHLYLSYCYENMYKETQQKKFLKKAINEAKLSKLISDKEEVNIEKQIDDLKEYMEL